MAALCRRLGQSHPRQTALIDGVRTRTFAELDARSDRLAAALIARDVAPGDRVAALLLNGAPLIELYMACAKARAILLPLNWRLAPAELAWIVADAAPRLLFVSEGLAGTAADIAGGIPRFAVSDTATGDDYESLLDRDAGPLPPAEPIDPWIMLYTSGTTGRPKGCVLDQQGQAISALASAIHWRAKPGDRVLIGLPLFHVGGLGILFAHLIAGATAVIAPRTLDGEIALDLLSSHGCTRSAIAPQLYSPLLQAQRRRQLPLRLQLLSMGGGMHDAQEIAAIRDGLCTDILLGYGQTEAGNFISYLDVADQLERPRSCGRGMAHLDLRIVDEAGAVLGPDQPGELQVRGASVLQRYWNQPEATTAAIGDGGWLRTGDLMSIDEAGYLTLHGRLKDLIKSGGENVYPKEVEGALLQHPAVADCAVFGVPHPIWTEAVKAVVVLKDGTTLDRADLVAWCRDRIAGYKRPRYIEQIDRLPRSDAGKLMMRDLRSRPVTPEQETG